MITRLVLQNWRTHEYSELRFSQGVNGLLGVMGAGKSSVLEAICFALFGTFPALQQRRIKLDNILMRWPKKAETATAALEFELDDGKKYVVSRKIERGRGTTFAELACDGQVLESPNSQRVTEALEKILRINYDLFAQIIYAEQNRLDYFLAVARGKRRAHFDELLCINKFELARDACVKLGNKLKEKRKLKREDWLRLDSQLGLIDLSALRNEVKESELEAREIDRHIGALAEEAQDLSGRLKELRAREKAARENEMAVTRLEGSIKQIASQLERFGDLEDFTQEKVRASIKEARQDLEAQRQLEKELARLEQEERLLSRRLQELDKEIYELETSKERLAELKEAEATLQGLDARIREVSEKLASVKTRLEAENKALRELDCAGAVCPICETPLNAGKKYGLVTKKRETVKEAEAEHARLHEERTKLEESLEETQQRRRRLLKFANLQEDLGAAEEKKANLVAELTKLKRNIEDIRSKFSQERIDRLEAEIKRFERIGEALELAEEKARLAAALESARAKTKALEFDELELEKVEESFVKTDKQLSLLQEKKSSLLRLAKEKRTRLEEIEGQAALLDKIKAEVVRLEEAENELAKFRLILEQTQAELREQFMSSINMLMREIWQALYPYGDYVDVRLFADDDYVLQIQNVDGVWVDVEGQVSGGERMTAALTLRLALASLLAPHLKWLILDEPTHNLDQNAVSELASTLRDKITALVDQVFIITHDDALAEAVTGSLYRLERGEAKKEATKVLAA